MSWLTKWAFSNKSAMIVIVIVSLVLGGLSYFFLPMEFLPEADNPQVTIATLGQGLDSKTMADEVTIPIENAVSSIKGKTNVFSQTGDGYSKIDIFFDSKTDMKEAKTAAEDAINGLQLPEDVMKPNIVQLNTSMIPIAEVALTFKDGLAKGNMDQSEKEILTKFESIEGVGSVALYGKSDPRIQINLQKDKMEKLHIPLQAVLGILQGQNMVAAVGQASMNQKATNLKVISGLSGIDGLKNLNLPIQLPQNQSLKLKDIAEIKEMDNQQSLIRVNGKESIDLVITKNANSSAVTVGKAVVKAVNNLNKDQSIVKANVIYTTSDMVVTAVNDMMREVLLGALFATIVVVFFLRNVRSTVITIISIPLSLGITLFLLWRSGVTLNILTLGGVAVAVGRLVDDSIVVIENIYKRTEEKSFSKENILAATKEVGLAITSSTLTTIAVFLPIGLIQGSLRSFLHPFALTITYSLLASLFTALTVVPLMSHGLLGKAKLKEFHRPIRYINLLKWSLNHKFVPILLAVVFFIGTIGLYMIMPKGSINGENASIVSATLKFSSDTPPSEVKNKAITFDEKLRKIEGAKHVITMTGNSADSAKWGDVSNPTEATITIVMKENADTNVYVKEVKKLKDHFPNTELNVISGSLISTSGGSEITLDLVGNNEQDLIEGSKSLVSAMKGIAGIEKISSNLQETQPVYIMSVDPSKAKTQEVAMQLQGLLNPTPIGTIKLDGKDRTVFMNAGIKPESKEDLESLQVLTQQGLVPLSELVRFNKSEQTSTVFHKDGKQYLRVSAVVKSDQLSVISAKIKEKTSNLKLPKGVELITGGASVQQASDFTDIGLTMLASIGLVYLIMVITFKNLRTPVAILMTLPLASIGAILGLLISKVPADPTALIGALMLIGIVVTNAIVLIDRVRQNETYMSIREAIIEGAATRLRPILMTAIATIFAMLPLLFANPETGALVSKGLAVVVIGGLTVATALTLIVVPVFYELLYFKKSKNQRTDVKIE